MMEYGCPRCGSDADLEDFEARPLFNGGGEIESLELVIESWCDSCDAASLFTDTVEVEIFLEKLEDMR